MLTPPMHSVTMVVLLPVFLRLEFQALHNLYAGAQKKCSPINTMPGIQYFTIDIVY